MKPIMRNKVIVNVPVLDEYGKEIRDERDRPVTEPVTFLGRVQRKVKVHRDTSGQTFTTSLEVDLPPEIVLKKDTTGLFEVVGSGMVKGTVKDGEDILNLSGTRVSYRTVFVDG